MNNLVVHLGRGTVGVCGCVTKSEKNSDVVFSDWLMYPRGLWFQGDKIGGFCDKINGPRQSSQCVDHKSRSWPLNFTDPPHHRTNPVNCQQICLIDQITSYELGNPLICIDFGNLLMLKYVSVK